MTLPLHSILFIRPEQLDMPSSSESPECAICQKPAHSAGPARWTTYPMLIDQRHMRIQLIQRVLPD